MEMKGITDELSWQSLEGPIYEFLRYMLKIQKLLQAD